MPAILEDDTGTVTNRDSVLSRFIDSVIPATHFRNLDSALPAFIDSTTLHIILISRNQKTSLIL